MKAAIVLVQIVLALCLIALIQLQSRGTGLGKAWGGQASSYHSRRGVEKILFVATIIIAALFFLSSIFSVVAQ